MIETITAQNVDKSELPLQLDGLLIFFLTLKLSRAAFWRRLERLVGRPFGSLPMPLKRVKYPKRGLFYVRSHHPKAS